eukprot:gene57044-78161_t
MGLDQVWNAFMASLPALKDAWPTVIGLMLLSAVAGYGVALALGSTAHQVKDQRLALADERVADYKEKLSGKSPEEAAARIASLEQRLAAVEPY